MVQRGEGHGQSSRIERYIREGDVELIVAPLLYCEVTNALRFKPDFNVEKLKRATDALFKLHMRVEKIDEFTLKRSAEIAFDSGVTIYNALPVAIAEKNGTVCVTADEKTQYNRLKGKYPVELLRGFSSEFLVAATNCQQHQCHAHKRRNPIATFKDLKDASGNGQKDCTDRRVRKYFSPTFFIKVKLIS